MQAYSVRMVCANWMPLHSRKRLRRWGFDDQRVRRPWPHWAVPLSNMERRISRPDAPDRAAIHAWRRSIDTAVMGAYIEGIAV